MKVCMNETKLKSQPLKFAVLDTTKRRQSINVFKVGKLWVFKHFFEDKETFKALVDYYNQEQYRFEFKSTAARNNALKLLEQNGFDYDLVEDLTGYAVKLSKFAKYAPILKNSVATKETATERIFLMKDLAAVEEAVNLGAKRVEESIAF
jgi:hypothetical protein